jgi:hypothetical protein
MIVSTNYKVGDSILVRGSQDYWRIVAIHVSFYSKSTGVCYDIQKDDGRRMVIKEQNIIKLVT